MKKNYQKQNSDLASKIWEGIQYYVLAFPIIAGFTWVTFLQYKSISIFFLCCVWIINIPLYIIGIIKKTSLFWVFFPRVIGYLFYTTGFLLWSTAFLERAIGKLVAIKVILICVFGLSALYLLMILPFFFRDYSKTTKDRLISFNFENNTYDLSIHSLFRKDVYSDFADKSFLKWVHLFIVRASVFGSISGATLGIIAGKISASAQVGIGLFASIIASITFLQLAAPIIHLLYRIIELQIKHKKWFKVVGELNE